MTDVRSPEGRLILVGNGDPIHIGSHLAEADAAAGYQMCFEDVRAAYDASVWRKRIDWWMRGRRPSRLQQFSAELVEACRSFRPECILSTGLAPIDADGLQAIGKLGIRRVSYLTDDPWNPTHRAGWFMNALPHYDAVFSPRRANLEDLRRLGCRRVRYLPFAYAPSLHYPDPPATCDEVKAFSSDVVFAGGADADRVPYVQALLQAGFTVALYGGYWERFRPTRPHTRGHADPMALRKAIGGAKVALCLVRRANRDGHAMRSFEVPAVGACMLVEDTDEHRAMFGEPGRAVVYFRAVNEMVQTMGRLRDDPAERERLGREAHRLIVGGHNTYQDRLLAMLEPTAVGMTAALGRS